MRKILLILLICITSISMYAQEEHFKFCGIELNGTIEAFNKKMIEKGFKYIEKGTGTYKYRGFFQEEDFYVYVIFNEKKNFVIGCSIEGNNDFSPIIKRLTKKYGEPNKRGYDQLFFKSQNGIILVENSMHRIIYADSKNQAKNQELENEDL